MSTGFAAARAGIEARFVAAWALTAYSAIRVRYDNATWDEPSGETAYVAFHIIDGDGIQPRVGSPASGRWAGVIQIDILVPELTGMATARAMADAAVATFDGTQFTISGAGTVTCRKPAIRSLGIENGRWRLAATVPFVRNLFV